MYLKDLVDIQMGQSPDSKFYNNDKIGLPFYQGKADFGRINPIPKIWCSKSKKEAKPNDILISVRAPVGDLNINNEQSCIGRGLAAITCKSDVDMMYLYYHLKYLKPQLKHISTGSTFESINRSQLENLIIDYKPYFEQIKISNILQVVQRQIEVREKLLRLYDLLIKSRFVEIFKNNKAHIAIGELFQVIDGDRGKNYPKATDFFDEGYCLFLNAKNVTKNGFCFDTVQFITQQKDEQLNKGRVLPEDIILTTRGTVGNVAYCDIKSSHKHMRINSGMVILRSKDIIYDVDFITYVLSNQINYGKEISGSAQPQLPISKLKDIIIPFPEIFLQKDFGYLIKQINKLKSDVQKSIDETQLLMDSLMQEYFG